VDVPRPTPVLRFLHVENLHTVLSRGGLHSPNRVPNDGLAYRTIHNLEVQQKRSRTVIKCGPRGVIHDYVPFYFGYLSPMLLNLKTGRVPGYNEGQEPLIYLVSTAQTIRDSGAGFVFSDGHGIAAFTNWFDQLEQLDKIDWKMVYEHYW
jgi:ssDNA thymidine ADP-ribosyltransferase, DarT